MDMPSGDDPPSALEEVAETGNGFPKAVFLAPLILFLLIIGGSALARGVALDLTGSMTPVIILLVLVWLFGVYDLLAEERMGTAEKILWMIVFVSLNILGTAFYARLKQRYLRTP
ncbi:MAG: hypothetical protein JWO88_3799 [Frankiales bacterium]|nr:hypothetical protein [Frankiales bacterium]